MPTGGRCYRGQKTGMRTRGKPRGAGPGNAFDTRGTEGKKKLFSQEFVASNDERDVSHCENVWGGIRSRRSRQRLKTEIAPQRLHQIRELRRGPLQAEPGVVMQGVASSWHHRQQAPRSTTCKRPSGKGIFKRNSKSAPIIIGNWLMSISPSSETLPRNPIGLSVTLLNTLRKYGS